MKKLVSLVLSVSMIASMGAVSFAAAEDATLAHYEVKGSTSKDGPDKVFSDLVKQDGTTWKYNDEDGYPISSVLIGPFGYNSDDKNLETQGRRSVQYGETAYFLLTERYATVSASDGTITSPGNRLVSESESTDGLKVKDDWEDGSKLVDDVAITKKKVNKIGWYDSEKDFHQDSTFETNLTTDYGFSTGKYYYMVAITVRESSSTSDSDIIGTLTLSKSKKPKCNSIEFDTEINIDWEESYRNNTDLDSVSDGFDVEPEVYYSVKFDGDEEIEIAFKDDSIFTVDISGQPKTLLYYDTDFDSSVATKFPYAELNFWNGNGAKFNRTGEMFLATGDDFDSPYLYQINSDGTLGEVSGASYDDSDEGFYFKTRTLGRYVYSDIKLDTSTKEPDVDVDTDTGVIVTPIEPVTPVNPGTGAKA